MILSFSRGTFLAFLIACPFTLPAQEPARSQPGPPKSDQPAVQDSAADGVGSETLDVAQKQTSPAASGQIATRDSEAGQSAPIAPTPDQLPDQGGSDVAVDPEELTPAEMQEFEKEVERRRAKFQEARLELEQAIWEQRKIYINFSNHDDRTPAAKESFFAQRSKVRKLLDETYLAALDVCRISANEEAATFLITMIQHRFEHDIYDAVTMEGAARMIDGGSQLEYLYLAAARSAVVVGNFDMAKRLYEALGEEEKEEIDLGLEYVLETIEANFASEQAAREKEAREDRLPRVLLRTSQGDVLLELFLDSAPSTVSHFISLVEDGFYDGHDFYQVMDHLLALTGDPTGAGDGNCGRYIMDEHQKPNARKAFRGSLVMAKLPIGETGKFVPNSASSQFAILFLPIVSVSEEQTVFGRVIEGMDAIARMRRVDPSKKKKKGAVVHVPDLILEATVVRRPETLPEPNYFQGHSHESGSH